MRILILNDDSLPSARGGAAVIVDGLRRAYEAEGHEVVFVTTHQDPNRGKIAQDGRTISILSVYPLSERHRSCLGYPSMTAALTKIFGDLKPDAVHAHNIHTYLTYDALRIAKLHTDNIVLTAHDTMLVSFDRVRGSRYERLALAGTPMRMHWWEHMLAAGRKYNPRRNAAIRTILRETGTKVVAISAAVGAFLEVNGIHVTAVIRNGMEPWNAPAQQDIDAFRARHHLTGPTALFVGRIREDKGIAAFLDAAAITLESIPNTQFMVNGERDDLENFLRDRNATLRNAIVSTGWIDRKETELAYFAGDVVAVPSVYLDNFPTVNLEAMAASKPVVGTCFGGTPEVVEDGKTGIIVNPRNTERFAKALITLLSNSEAAKHMGQAGLKRLQDHFGIRKQAETYLELLE